MITGLDYKTSRQASPLNYKTCDSTACSPSPSKPKKRTKPTTRKMTSIAEQSTSCDERASCASQSTNKTQTDRQTTHSAHNCC